MAAAASFESALAAKLRAADVDDEVYGPYITSMLTSAGPDASSARPEIVDLLGSVVSEEAASKLSDEVVAAWKSFVTAAIGALTAQKRAEPVRETRELTEEERAMKQRLLSMYGQEVIGGEDEAAQPQQDQKKKPEQTPMAGAISSLEILAENLNSKSVAEDLAKMKQQAKELAEQNKKEAKESCEKGRMTREERKEKRREACKKGERRKM
eukprot:m51a1_g7367 hypothetical protein (211) ;mRNA; r:60423-61444